MIVFGDEYRFTEYELIRLKNSFGTIDYVKTVDEINNILNITPKSIVVLNNSDVGKDVFEKLSNLHLKGILFLSLEHFMEKYLNKFYIPLDGSNLHYLEDLTPFSKWQYIQKRFIDFLGISILLLFSFPVFIYSAWRIKKESPNGDFLFKQDRVGNKGKEFSCMKFRSMHSDSHFDPYTRENDNRIFSYAQTMRKYRIDELPQIWNIVKGEMHLIGPRAEWNILVPEYLKSLPFYNERHLVKPGITGHAQVNYPYGANIEDTQQKLMYDLYYIKNWSILLELKIVWQTAMVVIKRKGL